MIFHPWTSMYLKFLFEPDPAKLTKVVYKSLVSQDENLVSREGGNLLLSGTVLLDYMYLSRHSINSENFPVGRAKLKLS